MSRSTSATNSSCVRDLVKAKCWSDAKPQSAVSHTLQTPLLSGESADFSMAFTSRLMRYTASATFTMEGPSTHKRPFTTYAPRAR